MSNKVEKVAQVVQDIVNAALGQIISQLKEQGIPLTEQQLLVGSLGGLGLSFAAGIRTLAEEMDVEYADKHTRVALRAAYLFVAATAAKEVRDDERYVNLERQIIEFFPEVANLMDDIAQGDDEDDTPTWENVSLDLQLRKPEGNGPWGRHDLN